jgi:hypothetical protein
MLCRCRGPRRPRLLEFALTTAADAGRVVLPYFRNAPATSNKAAGSDFDPVTEADEAAERLIRERIQTAYPAHGIFGEEEGHVQGDGLTWVIDPIDGTRAFLTGMLHWGMLLALFDGEKPVFGLMHQLSPVNSSTVITNRPGTVMVTWSSRCVSGPAPALPMPCSQPPRPSCLLLAMNVTRSSNSGTKRGSLALVATAICMPCSQWGSWISSWKQA